MPEAPRRRVNPQSVAFFLLILAVMFFLTWRIFQPFIIIMVTGVLVAVLALPIDRAWERILPNKVAAFATMFTVLLLLVLPLAALGLALFNDAAVLRERFVEGEVETDINDLLQNALFWQTPEQRNETIESFWTEIEPRIEGMLVTLVQQAPGFIGRLAIGTVVILFVMYYVLTDGDRLVAFLRRAAPMPAPQVDFLLREAHNGVKAVFNGQILTSLIQGALGGIGFLIAGLPGVMVWAAVMAILSLLPVVGAFLVWLPAGIFLLVKGDTWQGVFLLLWGGLLVSQVDNFIRPRLIGRRADIHPVFVLVGVLGGVVAFGFIGLFLGPLLVGVTVSILKVWEKDYLDPELAYRPPPEPVVEKRRWWRRRRSKKEAAGSLAQAAGAQDRGAPPPAAETDGGVEEREGDEAREGDDEPPR